MTNRTLRAALAQFPLDEGNLSHNMELAAADAAHAASHGADLFCLPEASDFGWLHQAAREDALPAPGKFTEFLAGLAVRHRMWVSAGFLERDDSRVFNSAVLIDRTGQIVLKHRKFNILPELTSHLYDPGSPDDLRTADTEFGRLGLTICADNFDPAVPRRLEGPDALRLLDGGPAQWFRGRRREVQAARSGHLRHTSWRVRQAIAPPPAVRTTVSARAGSGGRSGPTRCGRSWRRR